MLLTGIQRDTTFSPYQHAENDRLILELTAEALRRRGNQVRLIEEPEVGKRSIDGSAIFSMCQGPEANHRLEALEQEGRLIINSPRAVQGCYRFNLVRAAGPGIFAPTSLIETQSVGESGLSCPSFEGGRAYWVKRGDVHATQRGDVVKVSSPEEYLAALESFRRRAIREAAVQLHIPGKVVKFYGVRGTPFFRYYAEGEVKVVPALFVAARPAIERLVRAIGLEVYGGDAVLADDGRILVIDLNDWPSFAYFRAEAADAIAARICALTLGRASLFSAPRPPVVARR